MTSAPNDPEASDAAELIASLRHHQDELEAQNHQLRALQLEYQSAMERYRNLYDLAPTGYVTLDHSGSILEANLAMADLLGVPRADLKGRAWSEFVHPEDQDVYFTHVRTHLTTGGRHRAEFRIRTPAETALWVLFDFTATKDGAAGTWQALCSTVDVTGHRQARAALSRSRDLFRLLARRLQDARDEERSHLAGRVHDQIGQSLVAVGFDIQELERLMPATVGGEGQGFLATMQTVLDACHRTLDEELLTLHPPALDILGLPAAIEAEVARFATQDGIQGSVDVSDAPLELPREVRSALFYILREGMDNVRKHAGAETLQVTLGRTTSSVVLSLVDDGVGVPEAVAAGAWGTGLLGASERAARFGGLVEVTGEPGGGTRLRVEVPLAGEDGERSSGGASPAS